MISINTKQTYYNHNSTMKPATQKKRNQQHQK